MRGEIEDLQEYSRLPYKQVSLNIFLVLTFIIQHLLTVSICFLFTLWPEQKANWNSFPVLFFCFVMISYSNLQCVSSPWPLIVGAQFEDSSSVHEAVFQQYCKEVLTFLDPVKVIREHTFCSGARAFLWCSFPIFEILKWCKTEIIQVSCLKLWIECFSLSRTPCGEQFQLYSLKYSQTLKFLSQGAQTSVCNWM